MNEVKFFIEKKNIVLYVILSIITCGIFTLFWAFQINEDIKKINPSITRNSGYVVLFSIITCGIYTIYFVFVSSSEIENRCNRSGSYKPIAYLVCTIFVTSIVSYALIQNDLNNLTNTIEQK